MKSNTRKKFSSRYVIKMSEFLENYVLPYGEYNPDCENIDYYSIMDLNLPNIKRIPNHLINEQDLLKGNILLVEAGTKSSGRSVCAYVRPSLVKKGRMK